MLKRRHADRQSTRQTREIMQVIQHHTCRGRQEPNRVGVHRDVAGVSHRAQEPLEYARTTVATEVLSPCE
jgi:hypothetical protein